MLDTRLAKHLKIRSVSEDRLALEGAGEMLEPGSFGTRRARRRDVDDAHAMPLGVEQAREESTHTATADDDDVHLFSS